MCLNILTRIQAASKAFFLHLGFSIFICAIAAVLIFAVWFPFPYRSLLGGQYLFWTVVGVDIVSGPLLTLVLFNPSKSKRELRFDITLVVFIQLIALGYGVYSISLARPVIQAFETDRFVVVSAAEIDSSQLSYAQPKYQSLSWKGPILVGTRSPKDGNELLDSVELSLKGIEPSVRPDWWQSYEMSIPNVKQRMKKLLDLYKVLPTIEKNKINENIKKTNKSPEELYYLPLTNRKNLDNWIVLLDAQAEIVGYAPVGGFN